MEAGQLGVWSWDLRSQRMTWTTNLASFHGYQAGTPDASFSLAPGDLPAQDRGGLLATIHYGRVDANIAGYARGRTLDVEPNLGAFGGLFQNPGFANVNVNINYRVHGNLTAYVNVRNAFNRRYEEIYGFPAPLLNVVAGLKWSLARAR